ncbi:hypothetical protein ACLX1H_008265 [Fusarium chlamydosporum]
MSSSSSDEEREGVQPLHIPSTPYATSYKSTYTLPDGGILDTQDIVLLQHLNCSYFSSGRPPTLLALKQHAHSLANLIRRLALTPDTCSVKPTEFSDTSRRFEEHDAFDWLNNLDEPYENDDPSHHDPLWAVHNTVKSESVENGIEHHCPLTQVEDSGPSSKEGDIRRPYMTHHDLVMHANECLEILDHEYSATGGLMSILPTGFEAPKDLEKAQLLSERQLNGARNCLLGQWLINHQHLIGRMHELEISYGNALDALAGEALIPHQILGRSLPDGVSGRREIVYPQDKFVLVNAGHDVTDYIHRLLDVAEAQIEQKEKIWKASGVVGERMWNEERGGKVYARGIVPIDIPSRFYRIKGQGSKSPLFLLPAAEKHPGTSGTRVMENRPTVVSVVTPVWPERVSALEMRNRARLDRATQLETENRTLLRERAELDDMIAVKNAEIRSINDQLAC